MHVRTERHVFGRDRRSPAIDSFSDFAFERAFRALPEPSGPYPFHLSLEEVLGPDEVGKIAANKKLVFHCVGDTGRRIHGGEAQDAIAEHMVRQLEELDIAARPRFFYHLGDVIYFHGQRHLYEAEFYEPYQHYTGPIFAIPGNHDGAVLFADTPLQGFMENFCAAQPTHTWMAGHSNRTTMVQPNCYWTLVTPLVRIIGLYSNVPGKLDWHDTTQEDWLTHELAAARAERCVIVAVHHPAYSLDSVHGGQKPVAEALDRAIERSGRVPSLVLMGHVHNYQRFTRDMSHRGERELNYIIAGAGGYAGFSHLHQLNAGAAPPPPGVALAAHETKLPGFLRITVTDTHLTGEYFTVPRPPASLSGDAAVVDRFQVTLP